MGVEGSDTILEQTNRLESFLSTVESREANNTLIMGDFNICHTKEYFHEIYENLRKLGFKQLVEKPTHIEGRLIDYVFIACPNNEIIYTVTQQAQYFTDHDLIKINKGNTYCLFMKKITFLYS